MDTPQQSPVTPVPQTQPPVTQPIDNHTLMGVLCYLGVLIIIPYLMAKEVPFVKYHLKQGAVLIVMEIAAWVLVEMFWGLWFIVHLINIVTIVLSIIGIVNVIQKKEKELPLVGSYAQKIAI
jgi:uncharacterized membrane protein